MNTITVIGHLGADPVTRFTQSGQKVTTFTVATNSRKGGVEVTTWFRITVWGDRFDKMLAHLKKGSALIIIGELQKPEIWIDKEGKPQITLEVTANSLHFSPLGRGGQGGQEGQSAGGYAKGAAPAAQESFGEQTFASANLEEEIPF